MSDTLNEVKLSPDQARSWLFSTGRAQEIDGVLTALEADDHLTFAGIKIALSDKPALLSEVYIEISPNVPHIAQRVIANISRVVRDKQYNEEIEKSLL